MIQKLISYLLLNGQLDLDAFGVRLCPHKAGVNQPHLTWGRNIGVGLMLTVRAGPNLVEAFEALEAEAEQLARLELGLNPGRRRAEVAGAAAAEVDDGLGREKWGYW